MKRWLVQHYHALGFTLRRLVRTPVASLLNVIVIGIALSLPAGAYALLENRGRFRARSTRAPDQLFLSLDAARTDVEKSRHG